MRRSLFTVGILACLFTLIAAWSKEDQEIFRLKDEVEASEGVDVTFYDFLGITTSASQDDINKAYRKKSRQLHPDKVKQQFIADKSTGKDKTSSTKKGKKPGVHVGKAPSQSEIKATAKAASDRFARLGLVTNILRGEGRERYDHFLSNGFPKWKGTGYYYARFRPGLGTVLTGLFIFVGGGGHWLALYMSWHRQQEFVERYIKFARHAAWGENLNIPGVDAGGGGGGGIEEVQTMTRKQRRAQEKETKTGAAKKIKGLRAAKVSPAGTPPVGATGPRKKVTAENGKVLVVDTAGNVYLEQADEDGDVHEFLLDPNEFPQPTIKDTALFRLPSWVYSTVLSRFTTKSSTTDAADSDSEEAEEKASSSSGADDFEVLEKVKTTAQNGNGKAVKRNKKNGRR